MEDSGDVVRRTAADYLDFRYLKYFVVVAESGSFTRAAERLNTVQPSISRQIKRLEDIVGVALFARTTHELTLTPAGEVFLDEARSLLRQAQMAIRVAQESANPQGECLNVGVVTGAEGLMFERVLRRQRPGQIGQQVSIHSHTERDLLARLRNGLLDVVFMSGPVDAVDVQSIAVCREPLVVALPADHPVAAKERVSLRDLALMTLIRPSSDSMPYYVNALTRAADQSGVSFRSALATCESPLAALQMVSGNPGFCFVLENQAEFAPPSTLVRPIDATPPPAIELHLVALKETTPAVRRFLDDSHPETPQG